MVSVAPTRHNTRLHVPPTHVHYSNTTSGKFSSILHTILLLHQVSITHFPTSQNLWSASLKSEQEMKDTAQDRLKGFGNNLFQQRHTKSSPTIWWVPEFTAWLYIPTTTKKDTLIRILLTLFTLDRFLLPGNATYKLY